MNLYCKDKCCKLDIYKYNDIYDDIHFTKRKKAGTVLCNNNTNSILLVQSRGNLWGFPKGSIEK